MIFIYFVPSCIPFLFLMWMHSFNFSCFFLRSSLVLLVVSLSLSFLFAKYPVLPFHFVFVLTCFLFYSAFISPFFFLVLSLFILEYFLFIFDSTFVQVFLSSFPSYSCFLFSLFLCSFWPLSFPFPYSFLPAPPSLSVLVPNFYFLILLF